MNRDDIIKLAREAGVWGPFMGEDEDLVRFAALVAAAEREACAKVCDPYTHGQWFAAHIRARRQA